MAAKSPAGSTLIPALVTLAVAGAVLFLSEVIWLQLPAALFLLAGVALGVLAIATPEFLEADADEDEASG
ncbi:MAG: hypothetical protein GEU88_06430 [Solirubrobacterales bacterium]|nr:hypothetical protein [Solirubrobacterales bacterium]